MAAEAVVGASVSASWLEVEACMQASNSASRRSMSEAVRSLGAVRWPQRMELISASQISRRLDDEGTFGTFADLMQTASPRCELVSAVASSTMTCECMSPSCLMPPSMV